MSSLLVLAAESIHLVLSLSLTILLIGLAVGVVTGLLQSVTQIQDQALSYVPRLLAILLALWFLGPGMMRKLQDYSGRVMQRAAHVSNEFESGRP